MVVAGTYEAAHPQGEQAEAFVASWRNVVRISYMTSHLAGLTQRAISLRS